MRKLAFALAAATALGVAVPASAQGLYVGVGDGGVGVHLPHIRPHNEGIKVRASIIMVDGLCFL
jgi:hypothetical protein